MALSTNTNGVSYVEWSSVIAGTVLAAAISAILLQFGSHVGLAATTEWQGEPTKLRWTLIIVGFWLLWVQVSSSLAGGYVAGRMRRPMADATPHESEVRDGLHGLLVWATGTVLVVLAAAFAAMIASLVPGAAAEAAASAEAQAAITENVARNAALISGFGLVASSLVSAVAAYWAATVGGDHRDQNVDLTRYISFRKR